MSSPTTIVASPPHVCIACACQWCALLPPAAPKPPSCVPDESDHQVHLLFWTVVTVGRSPSFELQEQNDAFEQRVLAHYDAQEPTDGREWAIREMYP